MEAQQISTSGEPETQAALRLPLHIERKALVSFPAGLGLEPVQLLNVPKVPAAPER